jgi:hypothetical protein
MKRPTGAAENDSVQWNSSSAVVLEDVAASDKDKDKLRKLGSLFHQMAQTGRINNRERFKKVEGRIWEFKCFQHRMACYQDGRFWVLTNGFIKKEDKWPKSELRRAMEIAAEDAARKVSRKRK